MTLSINMNSGASANGGVGIGLLTSAGNPWSLPDALAQDLVNRGLASSVGWPSVSPTTNLSYAQAAALLGGLGTIKHQKIKNAILKNPTGVIDVSPISSTLTVSKGLQNGAPVTATKQILNFPYTGAQNSLAAMAQSGKYISIPFADKSSPLFGPPGFISYRSMAPYAIGPGSMSFVHDGQYFEMLNNGTALGYTVLIDGKYAWSNGIISGSINNGVAGAAFGADQNFWIKFDMGSRSTRRISVYGIGGTSVGNLALANDLDTMIPADRSLDPMGIALTDSYGQGVTKNWSNGGIFREAAAALGIEMLFDAIGGTGYAPTATQTLATNSGRMRSTQLSQFPGVDTIWITLGLNDNASLADATIGYATPAAAAAGFQAAVSTTLSNARNAAPNAVLVVFGCPTPSQSNLNYATNGIGNHNKTQVIRSETLKLSGSWIFVDYEMDEVIASSGYRVGPTGVFNPALISSPNPTGSCLMTGTGSTAGALANGNADLYTDDTVHPNIAGCLVYGRSLANMLRPAIMSL